MKLQRVLVIFALVSLAAAQTVHTNTGGRTIPGAYTKIGSRPAGPLFNFGGDLSGDSTSQQVIGIKGNLLPPTLTAGYLHWNGTSWVFDTPAGGGGGTPGGSPTQLQFNNAGAFGGDAALTWDNTNKELLVGPATPRTGAINGVPSVIIQEQGGVNPLEIHSAHQVGIDVYTHDSTSPLRAPALDLMRSRGTQAAPSAVVNGDLLGVVNVGGYDGSVYQGNTLLNFSASENWTSTAHGTSFNLVTVKNGTTTTKNAIIGNNDGSVSLPQLTGLIQCLHVDTFGKISGTGADCGSGGGTMTWPTGAAGIANYNGASAWGTSYNASNLIPANFVSTLNQNTTGNAATATAINTNGTANQVWGMNSGGTAQGWQTVSGGGSGTVSSGTANQIAWYAATGTTVTGNTRLTDSGTQLQYSGDGHFTGNFTIDGTLSVAGPWFVNTVWPASPMGAGSTTTTSNIGISNDGNFYVGVGTGTPSMICTAANGACASSGMTWPTGGAGIPNYNGSSAWGTSYSASSKIPATFVSTLNQSTTGNAATSTALSTNGTANQVWGMDGTGTTQGWQTVSGGGATLDTIGNLAANKTFTDANFTLAFQNQMTTASASAVTFTESAASTATGTPFLVNIKTLAASTLNPFQVTAAGTANGVKVDTTGLLSAIGTGNISATQIGPASLPTSFTAHTLLWLNNSTTIQATAAPTLGNQNIASGGQFTIAGGTTGNAGTLQLNTGGATGATNNTQIIPSSTAARVITLPDTTTTLLGGNSDTTTTHVCHASATAFVCNFAAIAAGDLPTTLTSGTAITNASLTTPTLGAATYTSLTSATKCAAAGSAANPSLVACSAAPAGLFSCATNASTGTCVISTTAVTATSVIQIQPDSTLGTALSVTCNTTADSGLTAPRVSARTAGTSFTITLGTFATNPQCFSYMIIN